MKQLGGRICYLVVSGGQVDKEKQKSGNGTVNGRSLDTTYTNQNS